MAKANPILSATSSHFNIPVRRLLAPYGSREVQYARKLCVWLLLESGMKYREIASLLNRDCSTLVAAVQYIGSVLYFEHEIAKTKTTIADLEAIRERVKGSKP